MHSFHTCLFAFHDSVPYLKVALAAVYQICKKDSVNAFLKHVACVEGWHSGYIIAIRLFYFLARRTAAKAKLNKWGESF